MPLKTFVKVTVSFDEEGVATPLSLILHDRCYQIDRVLDCRNAVATKVGGQGLRYTVRILGTETFLFRDEKLRWFVEEKDHVR